MVVVVPQNPSPECFQPIVPRPISSGGGGDGWDSLCAKDGHGPRKTIAEVAYAKRVVAQEGFGLGGDVWGRLREEDAVQAQRSMNVEEVA